MLMMMMLMLMLMIEMRILILFRLLLMMTIMMYDGKGTQHTWQRVAVEKRGTKKQSLTPIILFLGNFLDHLGNFLDLPLQRHNNDIVQDDNNNAWST